MSKSSDIPAPQEPRRAWEQVQNDLADIPGEEGIERRRSGYAGYFLRLGKDVRISEGCRFSHPDRIVLDDDARINVGALIYGSGGVWIGRHARIGPRLFIHSANHDVSSDDERAFFERGYEYDAVRIGDNCLISANVSILPGAKIANGVFVAAGAVVAKGEYADGCRIMGVPGRAAMPEKPPVPPEAPSIAIVAASAAEEQAGRLLVEALGLPQVRVYRAADSLPTSVHTLVMSSAAQAAAPHGGRTIWRLSEGEQPIDPKPFGLPESRVHHIVPAADGAKSALENAATLTLYYALKRLRKRGGGMNALERLEAHLALAVLSSGNHDRHRELSTTIAEALANEGERLTAAEQQFLRSMEGGETESGAAPLAQVVLDLSKISEAMQLALRNEGASRITAEMLQSHPEVAMFAAVREPALWQTMRSMVAEAAEAATRTSALALLAGAAALARDDELCRTIVGRLLAPPWFDSAAMCVRSAAEAESFSYSPALAAILLRALRIEQPGFVPCLLQIREERLEWRGCAGSLIDRPRRQISRSLLDNWLACLRLPLLDSEQYELAEQNYRPVLSAIEAQWREFFRQVQHEAGRPFVRISPWPEGCRGALSLRYDIDRNTSAEQMREIVRLQARALNASCGSWFSIPNTPAGARLRKVLPLHVQECGLHVLRGDHALAGEGATCHSAPTSEYWRGQTTVLALERQPARYGEMLATQLGSPRRGWVGDAQSGRATTMCLLPIHFPLEGSTSDTTLEYFDRLLAHFRALRGAGGHTIIASHPDLNQALLAQLIARENLRDLWCAPIFTVVDRCQRLLGYGHLSVVEIEREIGLLSRHTMADVAVTIEMPDGSSRAASVQLNAGVPRGLGV